MFAPLLLGLASPPAAFAQDSLVGGTQPETLRYPLASTSGCADCHAGFANSPNDVFAGTMMAMAMHDPMFQASLVIAEQDIPGIGEFCLRCHTPPGWLEGRCEPGDGSALQLDDYDGVNCDTCHRMMLDPEGPLIGNARYTIVDSDVKSGPYGSEFATHGAVVDPFLSSSELCGVCHEVSNPLFGDFPIERTYSEWAASAYNGPEGGADTRQCQDCHLEEVTGYAANDPVVPQRTVHPHRFVGGNTLVPRILATERPDLGAGQALLDTALAAAEHLKQSADVEMVLPEVGLLGQDTTFHVKVTNQSGHKLPTGYPEGRRLWLEVVVTDRDGVELLRSGTYDEVTATLPDDPQLRKYEARLGTGDQYSYHMVQQNQILSDGRIPPKGFRPTADILPVGREFEVLPDGSLANWDLAPYTVAVPPTARGPITLTATLWHQTTTSEFVTFLRDENVTNELGDEWYRMWEESGRGEPDFVQMATATLALTLPPEPVEPVEDDEEEEPEGCGCASSPATGGVLLPWVVTALSLRRRARRR